MPLPFKFEIGIEARDVVTGFQGRIIARAQHLTGCNTYGLMKKADDKGEIQNANWFDEQRLDVVDPHPVVLPGVKLEV